jgi:hypothetical protein
MRRPTILLTAMIAFGLMAPSLAFAQADAPNVRYRKRTEIDFEDVSVDGELKKPHGAYLLDKRQSSFNPLIRMKVDFNKEMTESVNMIR